MNFVALTNSAGAWKARNPMVARHMACLSWVKRSRDQPQTRDVLKQNLQRIYRANKNMSISVVHIPHTAYAYMIFSSMKKHRNMLETLKAVAQTLPIVTRAGATGFI